jgi:hypothetical protein
LTNLKTILTDAVTAGRISAGNIQAINVYKGYSSMPDKFVKDEGYITVDDGGERIETSISNNSQLHFYQVTLESGVYIIDRETVLDESLDLWDEIKTELELEANRQKDGMILPVNVIPFEVDIEDRSFYRVRQALVEFFELEDRFFQY